MHHALYRILYPYFDKKFIFDSYSCRIHKGTHKALDRFRYFARIVSKNHTTTCWVLKCDIRKFFANIDHTILKNILAKHILDGDVLWLLGQVIDSFNANGKKNIGLPLGNLTSQLFVNVYMNEFDQFVKRGLGVKRYLRYADDFLILSDDREYLHKLVFEISRFLPTELKLMLHPDKVSIHTSSSGIDFLGWVHFPHHRVLRTSTKQRMFKNLSFKSSVSKAQIESYLGLLGHGNTYRLQERIEKIEV